MAGIRAVIFDLDGTLYDERQFVMSGFAAAARHLSAKYELDAQRILTILESDFNCGLRRKNFNVLVEKLKLPFSDVDELKRIYREHKPKINCYPEVQKILDDLKGKFGLGLITDGYGITQRNKISALNLDGYFDATIITDVLGKGHRKPDAKAFQLILEELGVKANEAVYMGDNPVKDFRTPKRLGFLTVRVRRGSGEYDSIELDKDHEADRTIPDLNFLREELELESRL